MSEGVPNFVEMATASSVALHWLIRPSGTLVPSAVNSLLRATSQARLPLHRLRPDSAFQPA